MRKHEGEGNKISTIEIEEAVFSDE